jgi:hypothetical protein
MPPKPKPTKASAAKAPAGAGAGAGAATRAVSSAANKRAHAVADAAAAAIAGKTGRAAKDALFEAVRVTLGKAATPLAERADGKAASGGSGGGPALLPQTRKGLAVPELTLTEALTPGRLATALRDHGVVVVLDVVPADSGLCEAAMQSMVGLHEVVSGHAFSRATAEHTWMEHLVAPQVSDGQTQGVGHMLPALCDLRAHPNVVAVFAQAYSGLQGATVTPEDLVVSLQGFSVRPPVEPLDRGDDRVDKPYMDMSVAGMGEEVVLGDLVVNRSSAPLRVSPGSHKLADDLLTARFEGAEHKGDFTRLPLRHRKAYKAALHAVGGKYQVSLRPRVGTLVLRLCSTLHADPAQEPVPGGHAAAAAAYPGPFPNWRGVVPVCLRPATAFSEDQLHALHWAAVRGMGTSAHGTRVLGTRPATRVMQGYTPAVQLFMDEPWRVFDFWPATSNPGFWALLGRPTEAPAPGWTPFVFDPVKHYMRQERIKAQAHPDGAGPDGKKKGRRFQGRPARGAAVGVDDPVPE